MRGDHSTLPAGLEGACEAWELGGDLAPLGRWIAAALDDDGSPGRLAVEDWGPCLDRLRRAEGARAGWPDELRARIAGLGRWLVHASRPDGSTAFGPTGRDRARIARLREAAARAPDPGLATVVRRWFPTPPAAPPPSARAGSRSRARATAGAEAAPPLPAIADDDRVLAILRPDWTATGDWLAVDHRAPGDPARIEVAGEGRPWLRGPWTSTGPGAVGKVGAASPTSWTSGAYADALEWTFRAGSTRITRTAVLLRYRGVAILGQQEDGPPSPSGFRVGLAPNVTAGLIPGSRAWSLARGKATARLIPLALPAMATTSAQGALEVEDGAAVLRGESAGRRRWLPLVVAWGKGLGTWRAVTVTERSKPCPPEVAFGARIAGGLGRDGLLIYRSLAKPALRAVLGHQTRARFLVGRFTPEGNVVPLVSLD